MSERMKWPAEVDMLGPSAFCRGTGADIGCSGRKCLLQWSAEIFRHPIYNSWSYPHPRIAEALKRAADQLGLVSEEDEYESEDWSAGDFVVCGNDYNRNSFHLISRVWRLGMAYLGYTEGNPEAKNVKKGRKK